MKGFYDIEGTEICEGDEILFTGCTYGSGASALIKSTVKRFTNKTMYMEFVETDEEDPEWSNIQSYKMLVNQTDWRVLVINGEFKKFSIIKKQENE